MSKLNYLNKFLNKLPTILSEDDLLDFFVVFLLPSNPPNIPPTSIPADSATLAPLTVLVILPKISSVSVSPPESDVSDPRIEVKPPLLLSLIVLLTFFLVTWK